MKTKELLEAVNNSGRNANLIYVGTTLPTIGLAPKCDIGELMSLNLNIFLAQACRLQPDEAFVIGRNENSNFILPEDRRFSRFHCAITLSNGNFYIYDCSLNGTFIK